MYLHTHTYTIPQKCRDTTLKLIVIRGRLACMLKRLYRFGITSHYLNKNGPFSVNRGRFGGTNTALSQIHTGLDYRYGGIFCGHVKLFCRYVGLFCGYVGHCDSASQGLFPRKCAIPLSRGPYIHTCTCMQTYRHTSMNPHVHTSTRSESALGVAQQRKTHAYTYTFIYAFIHVCQICTMMFAAK